MATRGGHAGQGGAFPGTALACSGLLVLGLLALGPAGRAAMAQAAGEGGIEGEAGPATPSRDVRSASYCSQQANQAGFYDTEAALACRREEYTAAARARAVAVPPETDAYCESLAAEGDPAGPFSWRAFMDCIDTVQP